MAILGGLVFGNKEKREKKKEEKRKQDIINSVKRNKKDEEYLKEGLINQMKDDYKGIQLKGTKIDTQTRNGPNISVNKKQILSPDQAKKFVKYAGAK